jgi:serine/threonine protein kinase
MAPEIIERGIVTRSADLYSLGLIIIEIVTGQKEYPATDVRITYAIVTSIKSQFVFC